MSTELATEQQTLKSVKSLVKGSELEAAIALLKSFLLEQSQSIKGWIALARLHRRLGNSPLEKLHHRAQALQAFQQAEQLSPNHPTVPIDCAIELGELGQYKAAEQKLREMIASQPDRLLAHHHLGVLYKKQQKREQAIHTFQQALALDAEHVSTHLQLAVTYKELGKHDQAEQKLRFILTKSPDHFHALLQLGALAREKKDFDTSLRYYQRAQDAAPDRIEPLLQIAKTSILCNQFAVAEQTLQAILEKHPNDFRVYSELGQLNRKQGNYQSAADYFEQAQQHTKQPAHRSNAAVQVAIALRDLGQLEASAQKLNAVLSDEPNHLSALQNLGLLYRKQQKREAAIACYQQALTIDPQYLPSHLQLANTWRELGNYPKAQQQLETAHGHHPENTKVLLSLATLAREQQQIPLALDYCEQAYKADPGQLEPPLCLAETLRISNHLDQAKTHLTRLLEQHPNNPKIFLQMGHLERQNGQRQFALEWFQQAQQHASSSDQALSAQQFILEELRSLNRLEDALDLSEKILQQHPEAVRANLIQADILQTQLKLGAAEAQYQSITEVAPHNIHTYLQLANLLRETYRLPEAITLLEKCYQDGHREFPLLMRLGYFAKAEKDWARAYYWFDQAKQQYPHRTQVYGALANALYSQGEVSAAMDLLADACDRFHQSPEIPLCLATLKLQFGQPNESLTILQSAYKKSPFHIPTALQLARLHLQQGNIDQVSAILTTIDSDHSPWLKQIQKLWGDMALWQFDLEKAIQHFQTVVSILPTTSQEHQRLALTLMLTGKIEQAHTQLTLATEALHAQKTSGKGGYPIKSHVAFLINQMRNNPQLCEELVRSQSVSIRESQSVPVGESQPELGQERLLILAAVVAQEPNYLGGSAFLTKELRQQGIFAQLRHHIAAHTKETTIQIPKRIVQYWDNASPPADIIEVGNSWQTHNPDYHYIRFSFSTAAQFIKQHYDSDVLKAFQYCDHPATQSDFFRLAYLNKMGGFYADADDRCRHSLDDLIASNAELIVYQEENACIGNNFLSCIPGQPMIRAAFYQAVANLLCYNNESPWLKTGPGLITTMLCSSLLPYLSHPDYRAWPKFCVLSQEELRRYVWWPVNLPYKHTAKGWQQLAYRTPK